MHLAAPYGLFDCPVCFVVIVNNYASEQFAQF